MKTTLETRCAFPHTTETHPKTGEPDRPCYLDNLNRGQRDAVETLEGPVLILAGAGTGKTQTLTTRIAHILSTRLAYPSQILAVTFTNKAASEMRSRITNLVGEMAESMPWLGTFHSIGAKILRRHAELAGLEHNFPIFDKDDQIRLIKTVIAEHGIDDKRWPARQLASYVDSWKNRGLSPDQIPTDEGDAYAHGKGKFLYAAYQERLKVMRAADFGDLLLSCITLLRAQPDLLREYQNRFRFIMVDEYQDTNPAQYIWLRLFANANGNICCVGDDDQSIYGWRGAKIDHILQFQQHFPTAKLIRLERNYRSTSHILDVASHLIAHNKERLGKNLHAASGDAGEQVHVCGYWEDEEEARAIGENIARFRSQGHKLNDTAVLVRASFQMRAFEDIFVSLGLSYRVIGGPRFYERGEVRDALAYLKLLLSPNNSLAFERIINLPRRGLGEATLRLLRSIAQDRNISLVEAAHICCGTEELKKKPRKNLSDLLAQLDRWRSLIDEIPHVELASLVLDESGYLNMWKCDKSPDAPNRLDNLKEFLRSMESFESLGSFLEHIALSADANRGGLDDDAINLMTLHAAKGLEFPAVFLPGWEEGLFPHQRSLDEHNGGRQGLEEERRLAYVGLTRARKRAEISFVQNRRVHGRWQSAMPSRFIAELPEGKVIFKDRHSDYGNYGGLRTRPGKKMAEDTAFVSEWNGSPHRENSFSPRLRGSRDHAYALGDNSQSDFLAGQRVFHLKFGGGRIANCDGDKLTVDFDKVGRKRIMSSFVKRC